MNTIHLTTRIAASIERCFNLARSIDFHMQTTSHTHEKAISGRKNGLIGLNVFVTWEATHFGIKQQLTSQITEFIYPTLFIDEMVKGAFKNIKHQHIFTVSGDVTIMEDKFCYEVPYGILGKLFNELILRTYLTNLLRTRNEQLKIVAESELWKTYLNTDI